MNSTLADGPLLYTKINCGLFSSQNFTRYPSQGLTTIHIKIWQVFKKNIDGYEVEVQQISK